MRFLILILLIFCFSTSASQFTKIGNISVKQGSRASSVKSLVGSVSNNGNFAVATFKPASVKGLGRAIARANPYTLAALAALDYYNENGQWNEEPSLTGDIPSQSPDTVQAYSFDVSLVGVKETISNQGTCDSDCRYSQSRSWALPIATAHFDENYDCGGYEESELLVENHGSDSIKFTQRCLAGGSVAFSNIHTYNPYAENYSEFQDKQCPPAGFPNNVIQYDKSGDGETDSCVTAQSLNDYSPQATTLDDIAPVYADDMQEWFNQSVSNLQDWSPLSDGTATGIEPEYIESYNQADVSPTFNEYLKRVASGSYQTIDENASDYVPLDMVNPAEVAITSLKNGDPFVDPTTGEIKDTNNLTDGASTEEPSTTVSDGTAANPINVTVNIPEDDTISQTEYEESNQKDYNDFDTEAQLQKTNIDNSVTDLETSEQSFIDSLIPDIQNADVPELPNFSSLFPDLPFGTCTAFSVDTMQGTVIKPMVFDSHCTPYQTYLHPLLYWFLYVMTGLYIFHLAGETFNRN